MSTYNPIKKTGIDRLLAVAALSLGAGCVNTPTAQYPLSPVDGGFSNVRNQEDFRLTRPYPASPDKHLVELKPGARANAYRSDATTTNQLEDMLTAQQMTRLNGLNTGLSFFSNNPDIKGMNYVRILTDIAGDKVPYVAVESFPTLSQRLKSNLKDEKTTDVMMGYNMILRQDMTPKLQAALSTREGEFKRYSDEARLKRHNAGQAVLAAGIYTVAAGQAVVDGVILGASWYAGKQIRSARDMTIGELVNGQVITDPADRYNYITGVFPTSTNKMVAIQIPVTPEMVKSGTIAGFDKAEEKYGYPMAYYEWELPSQFTGAAPVKIHTALVANIRTEENYETAFLAGFAYVGGKIGRHIRENGNVPTGGSDRVIAPVAKPKP